MWGKAFKRWQEWDFGASDGQELVKTAESEIDYAVAGSLIEGGDSLASSDPDLEFGTSFRGLETSWHATVTAAVTGFFRLLSRYELKFGRWQQRQEPAIGWRDRRRRIVPTGVV
ncbi:hypothetical protein [Mesorhizobium captivum]|uniref:hypothetical protein n=1 Tax=Mesorhizobium captivum TaxID=3072319 RepID=UPI002A2430B9|nr:hypothetical protein [Mesorhizobium sp. VK3C]MDX8450810.1 hypothetical protein [Mesorhizobium sp. VK3C]